MSLNSIDCAHHGVIMHIFLHALGVEHEIVREDRDEFIKMLWGNIATGKEINFQKRKTNTHGVFYDIFSIMHAGK